MNPLNLSEGQAAMDKQTHSQLELFSQLKGNAQLESPESRSFLTFILAYEKILLVIIGFIITGVVSFCIGVEKGKHAESIADTDAPVARTAAASVTPSMNTPAQTAPRTASVAMPVAVAPIAPATVPVAAPQQLATDPAGTYTVQVASYKSRTQAQKEVEALKRRGYTAQILTKKSYSIVCVGKFATKEKADAALNILKKQYRDCLLRRL